MENNKLIDLHAHTNHSDGDLSPQQLILRAIEKNVGDLAITDHDTIEGLKTIDRNDQSIIESGLYLINGIELSSKVSKGKMHILGEDIDIYNKELNDKMSKLKDNRINYILSIMEQLKRDYGIRFKYNDIKELINAKNVIGRPHIAKLCIEYGYATSVQDAFDKYLIDAHDKVRDIKKDLTYEECINLILNSGGIPVLAHPKSLQLNEKELLILIKNMVSCGLQGIEVYHSSHSKEEMDMYLKIANKFDLLISGGSDYHGSTVKPDIELGTGKNGNLMIKQLSILDKIKTRN